MHHRIDSDGNYNSHLPSCAPLKDQELAHPIPAQALKMIAKRASSLALEKRKPEDQRAENNVRGDPGAKSVRRYF
jgi:hypothetical protein